MSAPKKSKVDETQPQQALQSADAADEQVQQERLVAHLASLTSYVRKRLGPGLRARETSQDLVQSVCREILGDLETYEYRGEASFRRWLLTRAENKIRGRARFWKRDKRSSDSEEAGKKLDLLAASLTPSEQLAAQEDLEKLELAFADLPTDHQRVILLSRIEGHSHKEIAELMGRSEPAVRQLLVRALALLSTQIGG